PGHGLLRVLPGGRVGHGQGAVMREPRMRLVGARDHGERDAVTDHVDGGRGGRAGLGDLRLRRPHRPGAVDDDDLGAAGVRRGRRGHRVRGAHGDDGADVIAAFGQVLVLGYVNGEVRMTHQACVSSGSGRTAAGAVAGWSLPGLMVLGGNGARTTVTLSIPPDLSANSTSAAAAASGSVSAPGSASSASLAASGW